METKELKQIANNVRKSVLTAVYNAQSGHPGGSLDLSDILTVLYFEILNIDPMNPGKKDRDRFVLSKGHCAPALYSILAERGYFSKELLKSYRQINSNLQGHPDMNKARGVDMSTGSLGQGFSAACGMALAGKIDDMKYNVYVVLGDGELEEGQVWEAAMFAAHYQLDNLIAIVDNNGLQIDGPVDKVMSPYPLPDKFAAFGWNVLEVDGHDLKALKAVFEKAKLNRGKPTVIIAKTVKGKGVSFMENKVEWHGSAPNHDQFVQGMKELEFNDGGDKA
jgi:transketolase